MPPEGQAGEKAGRRRGQAGEKAGSEAKVGTTKTNKKSRARAQLQGFLRKMPHLSRIKVSHPFLEITRAHAQWQGFVRAFSKDAAPFSDQSKSPILGNHARTFAIARFCDDFFERCRTFLGYAPQVGPKLTQRLSKKARADAKMTLDGPKIAEHCPR